jgi:3-phosphoshikimate 1-carboxyvinyltransferase
MKELIIKPSFLKGSVLIPSSKSHTMRAILFGLMGKGKTIIHSPLPSPDSIAMIDACRLFGAKVEVFQNHLEIIGTAGQLSPCENVIQAGNSGQVLRFIGALAALSPAYTVITGDHSIRHNRPVQPLLDALSQLKAFAISSRLDGYAPIIIKGPMQPGKASLPGEDSQPISGLLIAASFLPGVTHLFVKDPGEKPWIDLTLYWLKRLGIKCSHENYEHYIIDGHAAYDGFELIIPGDFSSAAYPIAAALVTNSELTLENIDMEDCQGDKKIIEVLIQMGAKIEINAARRTLIVKKNSRLKGMRIDINDFIDAITIMAVIGCFAEGTTEIYNAGIARKKESDRIRSIVTELKKMGAAIEERADGLVVSHSSLNGAQLKSYHDHRIVMSLAVAALASKGETRIEGIGCVAKSYPSFIADFQRLGAHFEVNK